MILENHFETAPFFIIHDIISVGDKKCCKVGKWNEGYLK